MTDKSRTADIELTRLNCPFCGEQPYAAADMAGGIICCSTAGCVRPRVTAEYLVDAIKQWNTRASLQPATPTAGKLPQPVKHYTGMPGATSRGEVIYDWLMDDGSVEAMTASDVAKRRATGGDAVAGDAKAALEKARQEIVLAIAFLNRDAGTERINSTASNLANRLAQADRDILTALRSPDVPKPAAWQYRCRPPGTDKWSNWRQCEDPRDVEDIAKHGKLAGYDAEARPLYLAATTSTGGDAVAGDAKAVEHALDAARIQMCNSEHHLTIGYKLDGFDFAVETALEAIRPDAAGDVQAATSRECSLCRGAGFVTYRDGVAYETHDVEREEHLIEDCPECRPPAQPSSTEGK